jgi:hypothetical protein
MIASQQKSDFLLIKLSEPAVIPATPPHGGVRILQTVQRNLDLHSTRKN